MDKVSWFRFIIERMFCHHEFDTVERLERFNVDNRVILVILFRECKKCGKSKIIRVE